MLSCVAWRPFPLTSALFKNPLAAALVHRISGLVVEYIVAIDVTRARFPADALLGAGSSAVLRRKTISCQSTLLALYSRGLRAPTRPLMAAALGCSSGVGLGHIDAVTWPGVRSR